MRRSAELRNEKRSLPKFLFRQSRNDFFGALRVVQYHRVQISAERGFDCRNKFGFDIDLGDERTDDRGTIARGIVQAFEHGLRTLGESFTFGVELTQNLKTRSLFGESTL